MADPVFRFGTIDQARAAAIRWLEERSPMFGPHRRMEILRMGAIHANQPFVSEVADPAWQIRLAYDPQKLAHFSVEHGHGMTRRKATFCFHGSEELIAAIGNVRGTT
jgi:hypothetical protein